MNKMKKFMEQRDYILILNYYTAVYLPYHITKIKLYIIELTNPKHLKERKDFGFGVQKNEMRFFFFFYLVIKCHPD